MEGVKHILRGEDAYTHGWMWDSLPDGCLPDFLKGNKEALCLTAASGILRIKAGGNIWEVELPPDADVSTAIAEADAEVLHVTLPKKQHNDTPEQLQQLKAEARANNKVTVIPILEASCR